MKISMHFEIAAGKYEGDGEKNYKYIDRADTIEEAINKYDYVSDYPFVEMDLIVSCDGATSRIPIFGGEDKETMLRISIASTWMTVMNKQFVIGDPFKQLDEIAQRVKELEALPSHTPWQAVHLGFIRGELNWTEAFDALMYQCGMPMEEALKCLAEHFDRRPVIEETEVTA